MDGYLLWAILLLVGGLAVAVLELFIPSAGILGIVAFGMLLGALAMSFFAGMVPFLVFCGITLVGIPVGVVFALKYWPRTAMGRRIFLAAPSSEEVLPDSPERRALNEMVGKQARAKCAMYPGGAVEYEGRVIDAVSEGMAIEAGQIVQIVRVSGPRLVVRAVSEEDQTVADDSDQLSQPVESLGIDAEDDPFA